MTDRKDKFFTTKVEEDLFNALKHACEIRDTIAPQAVRALLTIELTEYLE